MCSFQVLLGCLFLWRHTSHVHAMPITLPSMHASRCVSQIPDVLLGQGYAGSSYCCKDSTDGEGIIIWCLHSTMYAADVARRVSTKPQQDIPQPQTPSTLILCEHNVRWTPGAVHGHT